MSERRYAITFKVRSLAFQKQVNCANYFSLLTSKAIRLHNVYIINSVICPYGGLYYFNCFFAVKIHSSVADMLLIRAFFNYSCHVSTMM